jgi:hypothetical protein
MATMFGCCNRAAVSASARKRASSATPANSPRRIFHHAGLLGNNIRHRAARNGRWRQTSETSETSEKVGKK